jgi:hypothetical protein
MSGSGKPSNQVALLEALLQQLAEGPKAATALSGANQAMFSGANINTAAATQSRAPPPVYGYYGAQDPSPRARGSANMIWGILKVMIVVGLALVILGRFSIGPLAGKMESFYGASFSSNVAAPRAAAAVEEAAAPNALAPEFPLAAGVVLPTHLPPTAQREDLVRYAREQAAYYAAQGVPQQEALAYISQQLQGAMSAQTTRLNAAATAAEPLETLDAPPLNEVRQPILPPQLPLVMPLTGIVPLSLPTARDAFAQDEQIDDRKLARKHKVSSESKEVQDYMKRRQQALGVDEVEGASTEDSGAVRSTTRGNIGGSAVLASGDPQETLL